VASLSLSFLGRFEVTLDAEPLTAFGADKVRALLAFLAVESSRPHRRTELTALFWPELDEKKAAHNLSQSLLRLRQALRESKDAPSASFLVITPQDIQFNPYSNYQLDLFRFRELLKQCKQHHHPDAANCGVCLQWQRQAAELYRGDFLAGLFVSDSTAFEEWRILHQEKLRSQALETLQWLAAHSERSGEFDRMEGYARQQIALDPWGEEAHTQLMRALAYSGRTAAALKQYESYQGLLKKELGIQPSAETTCLYQKIRAGEIGPVTIAQPDDRESIWLSDQGERRQVTVLVCSRCLPDDIHDDADEVHEQMSSCDRHCEAIRNRFLGWRAARHGDACMVYFGYPQAHEDAPRRAVHSGLAIAAALEQQGSVQIGIHTGIVTVGEKRGPRWQDRDLVGKALEIARDCQRLAQPGEVIITENTRQLVLDSFEFQPARQPIRMASGQPLLVYRVLRENSTPSHLGWLAQTQRLTALTGREAEMQQLQTALQKSLEGKGQVVLLQGEPGIGKSRLVLELERNVPIIGKTTPADGQPNGPSVLWLSSRCLPHYQNTSLYPIIGLIEGLLGFRSGDSEKTRREKQAGILAWYQLDRPSVNWLLSLLLGLSTDTPAPESITKSQREQMREVFMALLKKRAADQPLVLVIEDLHWSDPSSLEWLEQSLVSLASAPCLTLLTARPGFNPPWLARPDVQATLLTLPLNPLQPEQAEKLVINLVQDRLLDENMRHAIITQTDGIPLFLEELTKAMLEAPAAEVNTGKPTEIPATLQDSLAARLGHLGAAKETAQWAAVLGREFSYPILQACVPYDEKRLQSDLARLFEAELIVPSDRYPQNLHHLGVGTDWYAFKHALVQDAAYTSMLKRTRQSYHRRIGKVMEERFPHIAEIRPEILAEHYFNANMQTQAVDFWLQAGEHALERGETLEAQTFFERSLERIAAQDYERHWRARQGRERVLNVRGERAAQEAELKALLEVAEALDDDIKRCRVLIRQASYTATLGNYRAALPLIEAAKTAARRAGDSTAELEALANQGQALLFSGEREAAQKVVEEALTQIARVSNQSVQALVFTVAAQYYMASNDLTRALKYQRQSAEATRLARNLTMEATVNANLGMLYSMLGLYSQARSAVMVGLERAELLGDRWLHASALRHLGYLTWCSGDRDAGRQMLEQSLQELEATGDLYGIAACQAYLGYILEEAGEYNLAAGYLAKARADFTQMGLEPDKFEAQAVEARVALALGRTDDAQQLASEVWNYLCEQGTEGISTPALVYLCVADVLTTTGNTAIAPHAVLEKGYREITGQAEKISNPEWRCSFLENVIENKALMERWVKCTAVECSAGSDALNV
jgi:predicted ATPase/DNA-binding SARP family transcriptional activator/class 3 adenylate cyclase